MLIKHICEIVGVSCPMLNENKYFKHIIGIDKSMLIIIQLFGNLHDIILCKSCTCTQHGTERVLIKVHFYSTRLQYAIHIRLFYIF